MGKRKIGEVLWLALQCAKNDRQTLADAYDNDMSQPAVRNAMLDVKAFETLQIKLFGTTQSELDKAMSTMKPISILQILNDDVSFTEYFQTSTPPNTACSGLAPAGASEDDVESGASH